MSIRTRRISAAGIIVLAALTGACADTNPTGVAVPEQPAHSVSTAAATAWTASGPGTVTVVSDGTAGDAEMTYSRTPSGNDFYYTWDFETTADQTATVTLPWSYEGLHYNMGGNGGGVVLYAVVNDAVVATLVLLENGEGDPFAYSGTYTFTVSAGDTYGFRPGGTSDNLDDPMNGTFTVDLPAPGAWTGSGPGTVEFTDGTAGDAVMAYEYDVDDTNLYTWDFETTADQTATVTLPWSYLGQNDTIAGDSARVVVYAVVNDVVVATLVDHKTFSVSFGFSDTYTFTVSTGDTYGFRFGATSNTGNSLLRGIFTVDLPEEAENTAPVLAPIANQFVLEGTTLNFTASATDADAGQTVTYSLVGAPAGASIDPTTGVFSWTPVDDDPTGTGQDDYTFTVKATDSASPAASDEQEVIVTVFNQDPFIDDVTFPTSPIELSGGSATAHISFSFTDPGTADTHSPAIDCGNSTVVFGTSADCTYTAVGLYTVTLGVGDDDAGGTNRFFDVEVVNADPDSKADCKNGGWMAFGFQNQGQCIEFVESGTDSR